jgi:hypothetical protein
VTHRSRDRRGTRIHPGYEQPIYPARGNLQISPLRRSENLQPGQVWRELLVEGTVQPLAKINNKPVGRYALIRSFIGEHMSIPLSRICFALSRIAPKKVEV